MFSLPASSILRCHDPREKLRPAIVDTIKKRNPTWTPNQMVCVDCLDLFRSEYVEDALKDEVGDLTKFRKGGYR